MRIVGVRHSAIESSRQPSVAVSEVAAGQPGASAKGRHYEGATGVPPAPDDLRYETTRSSTAQTGRITNERKAEDLSWAHPAAIGAVLSYARTAYRNGFREKAVAALDPYFALIGADPVTLASRDMGLRLAFASISAMRNNLLRNLDYYGNPPGWVPRLRALSNLEVLKTVRQAAYGTFYFSDKMLRDYEALDDARAVSRGATNALKTELEAAQVTLRTAYDKLPEAMKTLDAVQQELVPVEVEITQLRDRAFEKTKDQVLAQRVFSAGMQILGGIAKSLPVGQPFVGLAGGVLGSISQFDWNAQDPYASAKSSFASLATQVTSFCKDNQDKVAAALTSGLRDAGGQHEALVTKLTRQLEDEEKEPEEKAEAAETKWAEFKTEERNRLQTLIADTTKAIADIIKAGGKDAAEEAAANSFLTALTKQKAALDEKRLSRLQNGTGRVPATAGSPRGASRILAQAKNATLKEAAAKAASSDTPPRLKEQLTEATRASEDQKALITARDDTAKGVMSSLEGLGSDLGMIGNGIVSLASPLTEDDPTWKRLAEQMLLEDPELRAQAKALNQRLQQILARKRQAASELFFQQQQASTSAATIASNLGALTQLSRQRQSLDQGLDPSVQGYLRETKERAKDALAESIYWFVKSFQYEFLRDVDDAFYNFDSWAEKLRAQEQERAKPPVDKDQAPGGAAAPAQPSPAAAAASGGRDKAIVLAKADFDNIGDEVFKAEQLKLGQELLRQRQHRGTAFQDNYSSCVLERSSEPKSEEGFRVSQMLDRLHHGEVSFNFIDDFKKGSLALNDARVLDVNLTEFHIDTTDPNLTLTIWIEHSGRSIIKWKNEEGDVAFYPFASGRGDDPVRWQFVYNHANKPEKRLSKSPTKDTIADNVKSLLDKDLIGLTEYSPGLFSDYTIRLTDLDEAKRKALTAVKKVVLDVCIANA